MPFAKVGDVVVDAVEVNRVIEEQWVATLMAEFAGLAEHIGLTQNAGETSEAFQQRIVAAVETQGKGPLLQEQLALLRSQLERDVVRDLLLPHLLVDVLTQHGFELTDEQKTDVDLLAYNLSLLVAEELGVPEDAPEVAEALRKRVDSLLISALWAPHLPGLVTALEGLEPDVKDQLLGQLHALYAPQYGVRGPSQVVADLRNGGPAKQLLELSLATGQAVWTLAELDESKVEWAKGTAEDIVTPFARILTPVEPMLADGKLVLLAGETLPVVGQVERGEVKATLRADGEGLELKKASGEAIDDPEGGLAGLLEYSIQKMMIGIDTRSPQSLQVLAERAGYGQIFASQGPEIFLKSSATAAMLQANAIRDLASGKTLADFEASVAKISPTLVTEAHNAAKPLALLMELQPPGQALTGVMAGQPLTISLDPKAKPDARQTEAIAVLQRYLSAAGMLVPRPLVLGTLDDATIEKFKNLKDPKTNTITLTAETLPGLYRQMAERLMPLQRTGADMVLRHPAVREALERDPMANPVEVALAYAKLMGEPLGPTPWTEPAKLIRALDRTAQGAVEPEALEKAMQAAKSQRLASEDRLKVLSAQASGIIEGRALAFVDDAPLRSTLVAGETQTPAQRAAARLESIAAPSLSTTVGRGDWATLAEIEPVANLKLAMAALLGRQPPVDANGNMQGALTGQDVKDAVTMLYRGGQADPSWQRVAEAIEAGNVVISTLDPVAGDSQLVSDVNSVLAMLREANEALKLYIMPADKALAASSLQRDHYRRVGLQNQPLTAALALLSPTRASSVTVTEGDFKALDALATRLTASTPKEKGLEGDYEARDFLKNYGTTKAVLQEVASAVKAGRLTIREGQIEARTAQGSRDGALEAKATTAMQLLIDGADVIQTQARKQNEVGLVGNVDRTAREVWQNFMRLPGFADQLILNTVTQWSLVEMKAKLAESKGEAPPSISEALRSDALMLNDPSTMSMPNEMLVEALRAIIQRRASPAELKSIDLDNITDAAELKLLAAETVATAVKAEQGEMFKIDSELLEYMLKHHADDFGVSAFDTGMTGFSTGMPSNHDALKLIKQVADAGGLDDLNISLTDDATTRKAKLVVQDALARGFNKSKALGAVLPGREAASVQMTLERMIALEPFELAPKLKSAFISMGLATYEETGTMRDASFSPELLRIAANYAETAAAKVDQYDRNQGDTLRTDATLLREAAAKGAHTLGARNSANAVDKALRRISEEAFFEHVPANGLNTIDYFSVLPSIKSIDIRKPTVNSVRGDATPLPRPGLTTITAQAGKDVSTAVSVMAQMGEWHERNSDFSMRRAVETALATTVQFRTIPYVVGYDLTVGPVSAAGQSLYQLANANNEMERAAAISRLSETGKNWLSFKTMMTAFNFGVAQLQQVAHYTFQGQTDLALGMAVGFVLTGKPNIDYFRMRHHQYFQFRYRNDVWTPTSMSQASATALGPSGGVSTTAPARVGAHLADYAARGGRYLLTPAKGFSDVGSLLKRGYDAKISTTRKFATSTTFDLAFDSEELKAVRANPDGRTIIEFADTESQEKLDKLRKAAMKGETFGVEELQSIQRNARANTLSISNRALMELSQIKGDSIPKELQKRLGIVDNFGMPRRLGEFGWNNKRLLTSLRQLSDGLGPPPAAPSLVPSFAELTAFNKVRAGNATTSYDWNVTTRAGQQEVLRLKNSDVLRFLSARNQGEFVFQETLQKAGMSRYAEAIRTVIANYETVRPEWVDNQARKAGVLADRGVTAGMVPSINLTPEMRAAVANEMAYESASARFRTTNPGLALELAEVETQRREFAQAVKTGAPINEQALATWHQRASEALAQAQAGAAIGQYAGGPGVGALFQKAARARAAEAAAQNFDWVRTGQSVTSWTNAYQANSSVGAQLSAALTNAPEVFDDAYKTLAQQVAAVKPQLATALNALAAEHVQLNVAIAAGGVIDADKMADWNLRMTSALDEAEAIVEKQVHVPGVREAFHNDYQRVRAVVAGSAQLAYARASVWATNMNAALAQGPVKASVQLVKSVGRGVAGAASKPSFYAMLALGSGTYICDLGEAIHAEDLSKAEKLLKALVATGKFGATTAAGMAAMSVVGRLAPKLVKVGGVAILVPQLLDAATSPASWQYVVRKLSGNPTNGERIAGWNELGVPEASFYKSERADDGFISWDHTSDSSEKIDSDDVGYSPRHQYVRGEGYRNRLERTFGLDRATERTTLVARLQQLTSSPGELNVDKLLGKLKDFNPEWVVAYREPVFPTVTFLRDLAGLATRFPELNVEPAKGFDFAAWQGDVRSAAELSIGEWPKEELELGALEAMLAHQDQNVAWSPQQVPVIERKRLESKVTILRWAETLKAMTKLPVEQKRAALAQLIENLAANHRSNAMLYEVAFAKSERSPLNPLRWVSGERRAGQSLWPQTHGVEFLNLNETPDDFFTAVQNYVSLSPDETFGAQVQLMRGLADIEQREVTRLRLETDPTPAFEQRKAKLEALLKRLDALEKAHRREEVMTPSTVTEVNALRTELGLGALEVAPPAAYGTTGPTVGPR